MKTGHDKRNQGDVIIRHNYVAVVGLSRHGGQGDGREWGGGFCSRIANKRVIQEENKTPG